MKGMYDEASGAGGLKAELDQARTAREYVVGERDALARELEVLEEKHRELERASLEAQRGLRMQVEREREMNNQLNTQVQEE